MTAAAIRAVGVCTPLGLTVSACEAAFRAALLPAAETKMKSRTGKPIRAVYLDLLADASTRQERILALARWALDDLAGSVRLESVPSVSSFIGLPDLEHEAFEGVSASVASVVRSRFPVMTQQLFFCHGRSAVFFALEAAVSALASGTCDRALVGGLESLCAAEVLNSLDRTRRLAGSSVDGIVPGEGAAFLLLERPGGEGAAGTVLAVSTGREARNFHQSQPNTAQALSKVLRVLCTDPARGGRRADLLYTCETGELFWSQEFSMAYLRNLAIMPEPFVKTMAAESFGDLGAAAGGVMLAMGVLALTRIVRRSGSTPLLMVCGSSDDGHVGACLVQAQHPLGAAEFHVD